MPRPKHIPEKIWDIAKGGARRFAPDEDIQFTTSPEFRSLARANASGRSLSKRMQDAQYNALAKNDAARERHQNLFGTQQMRGVI